MNLKHLVAAAAATALLGGAAYAQQSTPPATTPEGAPQPGSVTGDWNGAHAPPDDKQYTDTVRVPVAPAPAPAYSGAVGTDATASADASATSATTAATAASVTTTMVTNGPVPDTPENRRKYGQPLSRAGKMTEPAGN